MRWPPTWRARPGSGNVVGSSAAPPPPGHRARPGHQPPAYQRPRAGAACAPAGLQRAAGGRGAARRLRARDAVGARRVPPRAGGGVDAPLTMTLLAERFAEVRPLLEMEVQLARAALEARGRLHPDDEGALRYALSLARCWHVRAPDGRDVAVSAFVRPLRERLQHLLWPLP